MRYVLKEKFFSWGDDFAIQDAQGRDAFFVDGKAFSFGDQLSFQDMAGNELAYIKQKVFAWGKTYEVFRSGKLAAVVKKEMFTLFKCRFSVDVPGPDDLEAEGDFLDHEYAFMRHGETVAQVSKRWFSLTDTYGVDVADNEDPVLILASAVVVDMACHPDKKG
jgi:uncharacterized protein YxjI